MQTKFYWKYFTSLLKSYQLVTNHYSLHEKYIHLFFLRKSGNTLFPNSRKSKYSNLARTSIFCEAYNRAKVKVQFATSNSSQKTKNRFKWAT
jgi:hypothetical protein